MANPGNVAGGYKATLNNPNVSDEAKEHAQEMLDSGDFESAPSSSKHDDSMKNTGNVIGGYKATLNNPNVSDEAKEHAKEKLDELGA